MLLHRCKILRLMNKAPLQSTMPTGSEHVVGPCNASLLIHQNSDLNAEARLSFKYIDHWSIGIDMSVYS